MIISMEPETKGKGKVIVEKFFKEYKEHAIYESDLGWNERNVMDAGFTESSKIFHYYIVVVGFNISFYYVDDGCFYTIETELEPDIEVRRIFKNPNWDGEYLLHSVMGAGATNADGEILYVIHRREDIWDTVKINGKSLEEVLARSAILEMD